MSDFRSWMAGNVVLHPDMRCRTTALYDDYLRHVGGDTLLERVRRGLPGRKRFAGMLRTLAGCALMKSGGRSYAVGIALKEGNTE